MIEAQDLSWLKSEGLLTADQLKAIETRASEAQRELSSSPEAWLRASKAVKTATLTEYVKQLAAEGKVHPWHSGSIQAIAAEVLECLDTIYEVLQWTHPPATVAKALIVGRGDINAMKNRHQNLLAREVCQDRQGDRKNFWVWIARSKTFPAF